MSKPDAKTTAQVHDDLLIGTTLSHLHATEEAQKLSTLAAKENPVIAFGTQDEGQMTYNATITPDSITQVRIRTSTQNAPAEYRYFKRLASQDGTQVKAHTGEHGLSASAWVETDAQGSVQTNDKDTADLRITYPGYTGDMGNQKKGGRLTKLMAAFDNLGEAISDSGVAAHTESMLSTLHGEFPQAREVGAFLDKTMRAAKAEDITVGNVVNNSWSMGAANALASNLYFKHRDIPTQAILGDAWRTSAAVHNIAQRSAILSPLFDGNKPKQAGYTQDSLRKMLTEDVTSVYPAVQKKSGAWKPKSGTAPGRFPVADWLRITPHGKPLGDVAYIDTKDMEVLVPLAGLGATHHRTNIINHLATHGDEALHEATATATDAAKTQSTPKAKRPEGSVREPTDLITVSTNGQTLEFTYPPQKRVSEYSQVPVKVDLEKLLADFPTSGRTGAKKAPHPAWSYVPFANNSHQAKDSDKSYRGIRGAIKGGQLDMPEFDGNGFSEGNHRVLELQRQGFKEVYVLAYPEKAAQIEEKYGVGPKKYAAAKTQARVAEEEPEVTDGKSAVQKYVHDRREGQGLGGSLPDF